MVGVTTALLDKHPQVGRSLGIGFTGMMYSGQGDLPLPGREMRSAGARTDDDAAYVCPHTIQTVFLSGINL